MDDVMRILSPFALAAIVGFVGWVWMLWREHNKLCAEVSALRLHISENYPRNGVIADIQRDVRHMMRVVERIAGKVGVSTEDRAHD